MKLAKEKRYLILVLMLSVIALSVTLLSWQAPKVFAEDTRVYDYETKLYCDVILEDEFADDCVVVILDKKTSSINKPFPKSLELSEHASVVDLTHIDGSINEKTYLNKDNFHQIFKITLREKSKENVLDTIHKIENVEGVLWAGPDYYDAPMGLPDAVGNYVYKDLWGLHGQFGIQADKAWTITTGSKDVKVGIIDSGIARHLDLDANVVEGWDFVHNNEITDDDPIGHGTRIAGIIGAIGVGNTAVIGVSPNVTMIPLQVINDDGDFDFTAVTNAITWAINNNIDILNYSGGYPLQDDTLRRIAISNFTGLFVCSAGNNNSDNDVIKYYPSDYSHAQEFSGRVISVGNIDKEGSRYSSSNYGAKSVSIYAPGTGIYSTYLKPTFGAAYATGSGTSLAAPFVAGAAALLLSVDPTLSGEDLKSIIMESADTMDIDKGTVKKLNVYNALIKLLFKMSDLPNNEIRIDGLNYDFSGDLEIPSEYMGRKITQIKEWAFYGATIKSVTIPDTVTHIGILAFGNCGCLTSVDIPDSVTDLGYGAFLACSSLESVKLSNSLKSIMDDAFLGCEKLSHIDIPESVTYIGIRAFKYSGLTEISFPESVKVIDESAFEGCNNLTSIDFDYGVTTIGDDAFCRCTALTSVEIPFNAVNLGEGVFRECTALREVKFDSLYIDYVSDYMFYNCGSLRTVKIYSNFKSIGAYAFYGSGLTEFIIPKELSAIGEKAFENSVIGEIVVVAENEYFTTQDKILYDKAKTEILYVPNKISGGAIVPKTVSYIGDVFAGRSELTSITIPSSVSTIEDSAFSGCSNLTIYVELYEEKPSGWSSAWNISERPVIWGCSLNSVGAVESFMKMPHTISNANASGGIKAPYMDGFEFKGWASWGTTDPLYTESTIAEASYDIYKAVWEDVIARDFSFKLLSSGTAYEVKIKNGITLKGDIVIPNDYMGLPVTRIADYGFYDNYNANVNARTNEIRSITLPDSIKEIGKCAFSGCKAATNLYITENSALTTIGDQAFSNWQELQTVFIPENVTSIGGLAFYNCRKLTDITFASVSKLSNIGYNAFDSCTLLDNVSLPDSLVIMGTYVFEACKSLSNVKLPSELKILSEGMFSDCWALENLTIPNSVTTIGNSAFSNCAIKDIVIPASVTSIGSSVFSYSDLNSISVMAGNTVYKSEGNCLIERSSNTLLVGTCTSIIPNGVTTIGSGAFYYCDTLTTIVIPNSVIEIKDNAFNNCSKLHTVTISSASNLTTIGFNAFSSTAITSIYIPSKVTLISSWAFYGCDKLNNVTFAVTKNWKYYDSATATSGTALSETSLANSSTAAEYLKSTYWSKTWKRG